MPVVTPTQKSRLRTHSKSNIYLSILRPRVMWSMRINDASIEQGETNLVLDSGTGETGFAAWLPDVPGMEMWVGTSPGDYNIGVVRLREFASGDGGVTGTALVSRNSILWTDDLYVSFIYNWPLKPMFPLILPDGTFTKEGDIEYSGQNEDNGPVVVAGTWQSAFLHTAQTTMSIDLSDSYATTPAATVSTYEAVIVGYPAAGGVATGPTPTGEFSFTEPGAYWARFTVTDSNGNSQISYRLYFIHDPDPGNSYFPIRDFEASSLDGDWDSGGWRCRLSFRDSGDFPIMKNAPIVIWEDTHYGDINESVTCLPGGFNDGNPNAVRPNNSLFCGYIRNVSVLRGWADGLGSVTCEATTLDGLMRNRYQYSMSLETVPGGTDKWYEFPSYLDPGLAAYHFFKWHTRILECADVIGLRSNQDGIAHTEFEDGNFYSMPDDYARNRSIRYRLVCDKGGRLHFVPEVQLLTSTERDALVVASSIEKADMSEAIEVVHRPENTTAQVYLYGFSFDGTFLPDGRPDATPRCSVAPGLTPHDDGPTVTQINYQTVRDQAHNNELCGRYLAMMNNDYPEVRLTFDGNRLAIMDMAFAEWWTISVAAEDTIFGFEWTDKRMKLRKISASLSHDSGVISVSAIFEPEAIGPDGIAIDCPTVPEVTDGETPEIPPPAALGGAIMTGASANYLPLLARNWDLRTSDPVSDLGADPWWKQKQGSSASGDAIVWRCGTGNIYRSDDAGLTWVDKTPASLSDCAGVTPVIANIDFIRYDGNFITQDSHAFLAVYNNGGDWVSWLVTTDDDGDAWSDVCLNGVAEITPGPGDQEAVAYFAPGTSSVPYARDHCIHLTETKFITLWRGQAGGDVDNMYALVSEVDSDNNVTHGSFYDYTLDSSVEISEACRLSDSRIIILYYSYTNSRYETVMADVSGTAVTFTGVNIVLQPGDIPSLVTLSGVLPSIGLLTTSSIMMGIATRNADGVTSFYCAMLTVSGDSVTVGTWGSGDPGNIVDNLRLTAVNSTTVAIVFTRTNGGSIFSPSSLRTAHSVVATAGSPVTFGAITTIYSSDTNLPNYAPDLTVVDGKAVCVYNADITAGISATYNFHIVVGTISSSITWGSFVTVEAQAVASPNVQVLANSRAAVVYGISSTCNVKVYEISGTTPTLVDTYTQTGTGDNLSVDRLGSADRLAIQGFSHYVVFGTPDSGGGGGEANLRAVDVRFGRGTGVNLYVTAVDSTTNRSVLIVCNSVPEIVTSYDLGAAATGDLGVETFFNDENSLILYGLFTHTLLGSVHAIYSNDAGVTFSGLINTWGSNRCSALRVSSGGVIRAIRSTSDQAQIYTFRIDTVPTLKSTLPFPAGVNLRALAVSAKGVAYAAANLANDLMVVSSRSPFTTWKDITYDHPTDAGVNSVVIL